MGKLVIGSVVGACIGMIGGAMYTGHILASMENVKVGTSSVLVNRIRKTRTLKQMITAVGAVIEDTFDNSSFVDELEEYAVELGQDQI